MLTAHWELKSRVALTLFLLCWNGPRAVPPQFPDCGKKKHILWSYWTNFLSQSWSMQPMVAEIQPDHWKMLKGSSKKNGGDNTLRIVDRKCSVTPFTYRPFFILSSDAIYSPRYSIFRVFSCFCVFYIMCVKNEPINQVCYSEQSCRGVKITYCPPSSQIFLVLCDSRTLIESLFESKTSDWQQRALLMLCVRCIDEK